LAAVIAIIGGLATAVLWATTLLGSARSARLIGSWSTLGWVMLIGLAVSVPLVVFTSPPVQLTQTQILLLTIAGVANSGGLLFVYTALQRGKVGVVGPIVSTEGAIGAALAVLAGDEISGPALAILGLIAVGVTLAAFERRTAATDEPGHDVSAPVTALLALAGAVLFGINLFATSRVADELPLAWTVLPARVAGVVGVTIPLLLMRRLRIVRPAVPFVILVGIAEVAGTLTYAFGARDSAAIAAVLASQFAGIAAIAAFFLFGERLSRIQVIGVATIAVGVALLAALQAL
jgi:drug/metabolite transporter (DMT)-like permease